MKAQFKNLDTLQIVGFIISAGVSAVLLIAGQDTVSSLTLGFVLAAFTQLFDLQKRHSDSEERILKASALSEALFRDEWLLKRIRQIVEDYQSVNKSEVQREFFLEKARVAIEDCSNTLAGLSKGRVTITREEQMVVLEELLRTAHMQARAVSYITFGEWWQTPVGKSYLQENERAVKRGVHIIRIFVAPKNRINELKELVIEHLKAGVEVYVAIEEEQPLELLESYLIVDESVVSKSQIILGGQFQKAYITAEPYEVQKMIHNFNWLLRNSRKAEDMFRLMQAQSA
jgi:hypothetical protein